MSLAKYSLCAGATTGLALALISLLDYVPPVSSVVWAVRLIALVSLTMFFTRRFRDRYNDGTLTSGEGFKFTFLMFMYIGIIAAIYSIVSIAAIPSDDMDVVVEAVSEGYADAGIDISADYIEKMMSFVPYFAAFFTFLGHLILGAIFGAIYSSSFRRDAAVGNEC